MKVRNHRCHCRPPQPSACSAGDPLSCPHGVGCFPPPWPGAQCRRVKGCLAHTAGPPAPRPSVLRHQRCALCGFLLQEALGDRPPTARAVLAHVHDIVLGGTYEGERQSSPRSLPHRAPRLRVPTSAVASLVTQKRLEPLRPVAPVSAVPVARPHRVVGVVSCVDCEGFSSLFVLLLMPQPRATHGASGLPFPEEDRPRLGFLVCHGLWPLSRGTARDTVCVPRTGRAPPTPRQRPRCFWVIEQE